MVKYVVNLDELSEVNILEFVNCKIYIGCEFLVL